MSDEKYRRFVGNQGPKGYPKLDTVQQQKAAATALLASLRDEMPDNMHSREAVEIESPVLLLLEASLLEIQSHGGKLDPQMVGMLSNASNLADILDDMRPKDRPENIFDVKADTAQICAAMGCEIMHSGLVALPVISQARGVSRR